VKERNELEKLFPTLVGVKSERKERERSDRRKGILQPSEGEGKMNG